MNIRVLAVTAVLAAALAAPCQATTLNFDFSIVNSSGNTVDFEVDGLLEGGTSSATAMYVVGVSTGVSAPTPLPYNLLTEPGFKVVANSFTVDASANLTAVDFASTCGGCFSLDLLSSKGTYAFEGPGETIEATSLDAPVPTPIPAALPLTTSILALFGFVGYWRKRWGMTVANIRQFA